MRMRLGKHFELFHNIPNAKSCTPLHSDPSLLYNVWRRYHVRGLVDVLTLPIGLPMRVEYTFDHTANTWKLKVNSLSLLSGTTCAKQIVPNGPQDLALAATDDNGWHLKSEIIDKIYTRLPKTLDLQIKVSTQMGITYLYFIVTYGASVKRRHQAPGADQNHPRGKLLPVQSLIEIPCNRLRAPPQNPILKALNFECYLYLYDIVVTSTGGDTIIFPDLRPLSVLHKLKNYHPELLDPLSYYIHNAESTLVDLVTIRGLDHLLSVTKPAIRGKQNYQVMLSLSNQNLPKGPPNLWFGVRFARCFLGVQIENSVRIIEH